MSFAKTSAIGLVSCVWILACGGDDPLAELEAAHEAVAEARLEVEEAEQEVEERRAAVQAAERELAEAEGELEAARDRLAAKESQVDLTASDAALFRTIQKRLLEDDELEDVAISARIDRGIAFLYGRVPSAELRDHAVEIAESTPGISSVESRIELEVDVASD